MPVAGRSIVDILTVAGKGGIGWSGWIWIGFLYITTASAWNYPTGVYMVE